MQVAPETIYQALYGRGFLDLAIDPAVLLLTGRIGRQPRRRKANRFRRFPEMVMIRDRPAEVVARLVHRELATPSKCRTPPPSGRLHSWSGP